MMRNQYIGVVVVLLIVGGGAFYAGKSMANGAGPVARGQFNATFAGRGGRGAGGGITLGTIVSTANGSISIQQQNGSSTEIVLISPTTQILKQAAGTAADLTAGIQVVVTGTANSDGSLTANSIQIRPMGVPR